MKKILFSLFIFILCIPKASHAQELTIAVAANVQYTFLELKAAFQEETGIEVREVFGSSGNFVSQIKNGAPFDVFLSADMDYPQFLYQEGLTLEPPRIYAYGTLVLWTMIGLDISKGPGILMNPEVRTIAIANPEIAPYGIQAIQALKNLGLYSKIQSKFIYGESVAQANQFIVSGASDAGITAKATVLSPIMRDQGAWVEIDQSAYDPIAQGAVILRFAEAKNLEAARRFFDFLFSSKAEDIYAKHGYILPQNL